MSKKVAHAHVEVACVKSPVHKLVDSSSFILISICDGFTVDVGTEETPEDEFVLFMTVEGKMFKVT